MYDHVGFPRTTQSWKCTTQARFARNGSNCLPDSMWLLPKQFHESGAVNPLWHGLRVGAHDSGYETISFKQIRSSKRCSMCCIAVILDIFFDQVRVDTEILFRLGNSWKFWWYPSWWKVFHSTVPVPTLAMQVMRSRTANPWQSWSHRQTTKMRKIWLKTLINRLV